MSNKKVLVLFQESYTKLKWWPEDMDRKGLEILVDKIAEVFESISMKMFSLGSYHEIIELVDTDCTYEKLVDTLVNHTIQDNTIDLVIISHGNKGTYTAHADERINYNMINEIPTKSNRKKLDKINLRMVYSASCYGASLNQAWMDIGARVAIGSVRNNYMPEPTTSNLLAAWSTGSTAGSAKTQAYDLAYAAYASILIPDPILWIPLPWIHMLYSANGWFDSSKLEHKGDLKITKNSMYLGGEFYYNPQFNPGPRQVILYEDFNYQGIFKILEIGDYNSTGAMDFPNDKLSSIKVGSEIRATLFEHNDFKGKSQTFSVNIPYLGGTYIGNDAVSSIKISLKESYNPGPRQVILFENDNYDGLFRTLEIGDYNCPSAMSFPNDKLSSIKIGSDVRVTLYEHNDYKGTAQDFLGNNSKLGGTFVGDNSVSSIRVFLKSSYNPGPRQVILFEHDNYQGLFKILEIGDYNCPSAMNFPNDMLSSIKIGSDVRVALYEHNDYKGRSQDFTGNIPHLGGTFVGNDTISSIKVFLKSAYNPNPRQTILFENDNFQGLFKTLEIGDYNCPSAMNFPNDKLSSIKIGSDIRVVLYEHNDYKGKSQDFTGNIPHLGETHIGNDTVSSIRVFLKSTYNPGPKQVILFEHENYQGLFKILEVGDYNCPSSMNFPNDKLSSIKVGADVRVALYEHNDYKGKSQDFIGNNPNLGGTFVGNDAVSSVRIFLKSTYIPGPKQVILFEHDNYQGVFRTLEIGDYNCPSSMGFPNDKLSSIKIGSDLRVTLYEHNDYKGKSQIFTENTPHLGGTFIGNDSVSSIKIHLR